MGQAYDEISRYFPMNVGIVKQKSFEIDKKIVIGSVQTLHNRLEKIPKNLFQLVMIDEAHHYAATSFLKVARYWDSKLFVGWTATPKRLDGLSLTNLFEKIVFQYNIEDGIKDGFLAPIEAYQISSPGDLSKVRKVAGDFNLRQLSEAVDSEQRNNLIVEKYKQYAEGRQALAYCVDIQHAHNLALKFKMAGIECEAVSSDLERCPNRKELIEKFRAGEIHVLTNCEILTEGFDHHDVGCVMMCRPTQSETLYIQCIGRGTRLKSPEYFNKFKTDKCTVLDFVDNTGRHSLINAYELEKNKPISERLFLPKEYRDKLLQAEKERRERKIKISLHKDRKVDLLVLPSVRVWDGEKMLESATEKQIKWLKDVGIWQEGIEYTKKQASELISSLPCQEWQIRYLAMKNFDVSGGATLGQYQRVRAYFEQKEKYRMKKPDITNVKPNL